MDKLFHSKSNFWICYCSLLQIMNQCGTLLLFRLWALDDGLCHSMTVSMQISTMRQCTLTEHSSHVQKQNISQPAVWCRYFCRSPSWDCCWTLGSYYTVVVAKNTGIKKKSRLDKVGRSFLFCFFTVRPLGLFGALYWAGRRLPDTVSLIWCQLSFASVLLTFWTINGQSYWSVML